MNFSQVEEIAIPDKQQTTLQAKKLSVNSNTLWEKIKVRYVSLGDSIAAGHSIDSNWGIDYNIGSQYGNNNHKQTYIVPGCYTDLIRQDLISKYGEEYTQIISFAKSGDKVENLTNRLSDAPIVEAIKGATIVTVCIGANNILIPALENHFDEYVNTGNLSGLEATINNQLDMLYKSRDPQTNAYPYGSYGFLFDKLYALNKKATYVFTTIYHPYKYLYLDRGIDGFFAPLLNIIPNWKVGIPGIYEVDIGQTIKNGILSTAPIQTLYSRVNQLGAWLEPRIETLNICIRDKVAEYNAYRGGKSNFKVAETKSFFDLYPDRPVANDVHYNDLVHVEFTRGFDVNQAKWGALTGTLDAKGYFTKLAAIYTKITNTAPFVTFDMEGFANELKNDIIQKVLMPDADPHPKPFGHNVMRYSFNNVLDLQ